MFRRGSTFEQNMTLGDIENLLPYELIIYVGHITHSIKKYQEEIEQQKRNRR